MELRKMHASCPLHQSLTPHSRGLGVLLSQTVGGLVSLLPFNLLHRYNLLSSIINKEMLSNTCSHSAVVFLNMQLSTCSWSNLWRVFFFLTADLVSREYNVT